MEERLHLKGLNGLRAIAAISVVIFHIRLPDFQFNYLWPKWIGLYAVTMFFTISGFLITFLLLKEKEKTEISVRNFYIRRILRIWPLYFGYLLVALTIIYLQTPQKLPGTLPYYLLFAANIPNLLNATLPYLKHYWSIGAEEQFYIFWPWLIKKSKNSFKVILFFIIVILVLKTIAHLVSLKYHTVVPIEVLDYTRFECMATGGLGACLYLQKNKIFMWFTSNRITEILCWLYVCLTASGRHIRFVNHDTLSLVTVCLIVNFNFKKNALINLDNRVFDFLGRISFGIYIFHPLIIYCLKHFLPQLNMTRGWELATFFFGVLFLTIGISWLSYEFFEKRFLKLKDRFTVIKNTV
jgi:peptidoglycan/LPS O-acetylase OafA/YrhL